jgi:hypothetical protein
LFAKKKQSNPQSTHDATIEKKIKSKEGRGEGKASIYTQLQQAEGKERRRKKKEGAEGKKAGGLGREGGGIARRRSHCQN